MRCGRDEAPLGVERGTDGRHCAARDEERDERCAKQPDQRGDDDRAHDHVLLLLVGGQHESGLERA